MKKKKLGVYIGRLQPVHHAHLRAIRLALSKVEHLAIVLGSACQAKTVKNPWTTDEREKMIRGCLTPEENASVSLIAAKDYMYRDNVWLSAVQSGLSPLGFDDVDDGDVLLFGHDKDRSTFYLHLFPTWRFEDTGNLGDIDATRVRSRFFIGDIDGLREVAPLSAYEQMVAEMKFHDPKTTHEMLREMMNKQVFDPKEYGPTTKYEDLVLEYNHVLEYKKMWKVAPFPVTFVTTDAIIIKSGHILVGVRGGYPGRGLIAVPGGYINPNERIIDCCVRELKEETQIAVPADELKKNVVDTHVFDHPDRSLRGRVITHAHCINLGSGPLPKVTGKDDMKKAFWMPLRDVLRREEDFFEDHFHMIDFFVSRF